MMYFESMPRKNGLPPISQSFTKGVPGRSLTPDTRILDLDPAVQKFLDGFRHEYERKHGIPTPNGLWAHQLTVEEQKRLSKEDLKRRMAPWHRALWAWMIIEAMETGKIDDLPDAAISAITQVFGHQHDKILGKSHSSPTSFGRSPS